MVVYIVDTNIKVCMYVHMVGSCFFLLSICFIHEDIHVIPFSEPPENILPGYFDVYAFLTKNIFYHCVI